MLYLTIPLMVALAAVVGIAFVVWRKMSYLKKLTPESHEFGATVLHDFAPEAIDWFQHIPWRQYVNRTLAELEKLLHVIRSAMGAIDRLSDNVLRRVRRVHQDTARQHEEVVAKQETERREKEEKEDRELEDVDMRDPEQLKQEEQRLIVAIAQNPRDAGLYGDLAKIYMRLQAYGDAAEALEHAVRLQPENDQMAKRLERARRKKLEAEHRPDTLISG